MNKWLLTFGVLGASVLTSCEDAEDVGGCRFPAADKYALVWSDEFDGNEVDLSKWSFDIGDGCQISPDLCGWGNNELQYYTDRPENVFVQDGLLTIKAIEEIPAYLGQHAYTSARMITKNKGDWTYGRMEVRARLPIGRGLWPAIWMLPTDTVYGGWPSSGEIDIMEYVGHLPNEVFGTLHYGHGLQNWRYNSQFITKAPGDSINFSNTFHTYTVYWNDDCILFQVDGKDVGVPNTRSTLIRDNSQWVFDQAFHMILNVAVGGNLPGNPDQSTQFPQSMEVDFVRVYQTSESQ